MIDHPRPAAAAARPRPPHPRAAARRRGKSRRHRPGCPRTQFAELRALTTDGPGEALRDARAARGRSQIDAGSFEHGLRQVDYLGRRSRQLEYFIRHGATSTMLSKLFRISSTDVTLKRRLFSGTHEKLRRPAMPVPAVRETIQKRWSGIRKGKEREPRARGLRGAARGLPRAHLRDPLGGGARVRGRRGEVPAPAPADLPAHELVEVHHAVFHRRLVRPVLLAPLEPAARGGPASCASQISSSSTRRLVVGLLLGLHELALEERDLLGVVELDHVAALLRAARPAASRSPARAGTTRP